MEEEERDAMREVWIRNRPDGVTELSPKLAALDSGDRWLVIVTVVITASGVFTVGALPAAVLGTIVAATLAGEVVLGAKALVLALSRPRAEVHEVPTRALRRGPR
jgi:hypothetical protein